jgi:addiction module RelE/StbE family toxin
MKAFSKLSLKKQTKIKNTIKIFQNNPHDPRLNNHALHGKDAGKRAISAGGDLRLVFKQENNYQLVIFVRVGSHNQAYNISTLLS